MSQPDNIAYSASLTPQQRWQQFRARHLPTLTRRQRLLAIAGGILAVILFALLILPFLLPFAGPDAVDPHALADREGAFTEINGIEIYYVHLPGDGETVLLVHGQGGSTLTWKETLPALHEAGFDVYALDLPGAGLSEKGLQLDYSHPGQVELIEAFLDQQGIGQTHLVAHAFSGNVALMMAQQYPARVGKIALVAPTIITVPPPRPPGIVFKLPFLKRWTRVLMHLVIPEAVGEQLRSATKKDEVVTDDLIADYARVLYTEDWDLTAIGMVRDSYRNALTAPISEIQQPVLLLWGTGDGWSPPDRADSLEAELAHVDRVMFEDVGHLPMHEVPDAFNTALINFLHN